MKIRFSKPVKVKFSWIWMPDTDNQNNVLIIMMGIVLVSIYAWKRPKVNWKQKRRELKLLWRDYILNKPIYYYEWSRDCDCVESGSYGMVKNRYWYNKIKNDLYANAEGDCCIHRVTKNEYDETPEEVWRDRIMEAWENTGQGYYV